MSIDLSKINKEHRKETAEKIVKRAYSKAEKAKVKTKVRQ